VSSDTGIGNPEFATAQKGERFFKAICEKAAFLFTELCDADIENLYE
jgi:creatinine amidohydrolase